MDGAPERLCRFWEKANANANAGVLRFAQNDRMRQVLIWCSYFAGVMAAVGRTSFMLPVR